MIYFIIYTLLLLLSITPFFTSKFQKIEIYLLNIFTVVLFLISGFRDSIGHDYQEYIQIFQRSSIVNNFDELNKIHGEYLFLFVNIFLSKINLNYRAMFILYSFLALILLKKIIKINQEKYILFSVYIYTSFYFLREMMGFIRYSLASLICIYGLKYVKERSLLKFILIIFLACMIQSASIIFLPAYCLYNMKISKKVWLIFLGLSFVFYKINGVILVYNYLSPIIPTQINQKIYSTINFSDFGKNAGFSVYQIYLIITFIFCISLKKIQKIQGEINIYLMGIVLYFSFLNIAIYASRFSDIYLKVSIIIFPKLIGEIKDKKIRLNIILFILIVATYVYSSQILKKQELFLPYRSWLF